MARKLHSAIVAVALAIGALQATPALAQRVFVAAQGSDANPCTFALPCRTFQHAHDTVAAGGEIDVLDPAGYGALTISKAISIQGHGFSGISVASGIGITINAPATASVGLNGLLIDGGGVGGFGVVFNSGKSLSVENCVIRNVVNDALQFSSSASTAQTLSIAKSYFTHTSGSGVAVLTHSSGAVTATIERSGFYGNLISVNVDGSGGTGTLSVAVTDSIASNDLGGTAFEAFSAAGHSVTILVLTRSTASGNDTGVGVFGTTASLRLAQSTVTGNTTGYVASSGGTLFSYGDNYIDANGGNTGSLTSATKQ
jgi:hypothetical protein